MKSSLILYVPFAVAALCSTGIASAKNKEETGGGKDRFRLALRSIPIVDVQSTSVSRKRLSFRFRNETDSSIRYMQVSKDPPTCASLELILMKNGKPLSPNFSAEGPEFHKSLVRTLKPNGELTAVLDLSCYDGLTPGKYVIDAKYNVAKTHWAVKEFGLTPLQFKRTVMILQVFESLPKKTHLSSQHRVRWTNAKSPYLLGVHVGLGTAWDKKSTFFFVVGRLQHGKTTLQDPPDSILRPFRVDPKSKIETKVYSPFPESQDPIIQIHVLVTEPDKTQRYLLVDLSESGSPALPTVKKQATFKSGRLYKLDELVEPAPKTLRNVKRARINRRRNKSSYFVAVGFGPTWQKKASLFFVIREAERGKTKLKDPPLSYLRPFRVDPKSKIETMVYNPFPGADEEILQVHVLVTQPDKTQHYFVVDLAEHGEPKFPTLAKKQTLKPGKRYKLHQKKLGLVELVPVDKK